MTDAARPSRPDPSESVDFLGIGAQKAGTTWVFRQLSRHPQVAFPCGKEAHYWDRHAAPRAEEWVRMLQPASRRTEAGRQVRTGEITPAYALLSEGPIRAIRERCPDLRVFMVLRNPIERAWSAALMELARAGGRLEETDDQWFLDLFRASGSRQRGDYATTLERWWSVFPREQLLVLFHDDLAARPRGFLASLAAHLGISPAEFAELSEDAVREVVVPSIDRDDVPRPVPRPSLFRALLALHADDIARAERCLSRDLRSWREPPGESTAAGPRVAVHVGRPSAASLDP